MSFSSDMAATTVELLKEFGQSVTITRLGMGVEDVTTGVVTPEELVSTETGVLLDFEYRSFGEGIRPEAMIGRINKRLLLTTTTRLKAGDRVQVDGEVYAIVVIKLVNPAGTRILYDLWIQQ